MFDLRHSFPGQEQSEALFIFVRPYWVAFLPTTGLFFLLFSLSVIAQYAIFNKSLLDFGDLGTTGGILFLGLFQLIILIVFFVAVFDFYYDLLIVTDRRLVDIDQEQLLLRRISELSLEDVQDATSEIKGLFPTIFAYGDVEIQTAGARDNFLVKNIRNPYEIRALILDLAAQAHEGTKDLKRWPENKIVGIINNKLITNTDDLIAEGAIIPEDLSRISSHATQ